MEKCVSKCQLIRASANLPFFSTSHSTSRHFSVQILHSYLYGRSIFFRYIFLFSVCHRPLRYTQTSTKQSKLESMKKEVEFLCQMRKVNKTEPFSCLGVLKAYFNCFLFKREREQEAKVILFIFCAVSQGNRGYDIDEQVIERNELPKKLPFFFTEKI